MRRLALLLGILASISWITSGRVIDGDMRCYACTSYMEQCKNTVNNTSGDVFKTRCTSKCFVRHGEDDAIYRGCFDGFVEVPGLKHNYTGCQNQSWPGTTSYTWCLCDNDICNGDSMHSLESFQSARATPNEDLYNALEFETDDSEKKDLSDGMDGDMGKSKKYDWKDYEFPLDESPQKFAPPDQMYNVDYDMGDGVQRVPYNMDYDGSQYGDMGKSKKYVGKDYDVPGSFNGDYYMPPQEAGPYGYPRGGYGPPAEPEPIPINVDYDMPQKYNAEPLPYDAQPEEPQQLKPIAVETAYGPPPSQSGGKMEPFSKEGEDNEDFAVHYQMQETNHGDTAPAPAPPQNTYSQYNYDNSYYNPYPSQDPYYQRNNQPYPGPYDRRQDYNKQPFYMYDNYREPVYEPDIYPATNYEHNTFRESKYDEANDGNSKNDDSQIYKDQYSNEDVQAQPYYGYERNQQYPQSRYPQEPSYPPSDYDQGYGSEEEETTGSEVSARLASQIRCSKTGFYQNPEDCRTFVACIRDPHSNTPIMHLMRCPASLVWDNKEKICNDVSSTCKTESADNYYSEQYYNEQPPKYEENQDQYEYNGLTK